MIRPTVLFCLMVALAAWTDREARAVASGPLKAGAATSNITPPLGSDIIGGFHPYPATHVHDELLARCLVLDNGHARIAIVICDLLGIGREVSDEARRLIEQQCQIPATHVLIAATHTHSAASALGQRRFAPDEPSLDEYQQFVVRRIADGVRRAINQLEPAEIATAACDRPEHVFNRRWHMKPGSIPLSPLGTQDRVKMNPPRASADLVEPAGPTDPQLWIVQLRSQADQRPIAMLANYSLHYVGGVGAGHISADYFGAFAEQVTERMGAGNQYPPLVVMLSNGTSGDINNINFRQPAQERGTPYAKIQQVAGDLASAAVESLGQANWVRELPLAASYRELEVGTRSVPIEQMERARALLSEPRDLNQPESLELIYARRTLDLAEWPEQVALPLQVLRIGNLGIGTMPCEVFVEIGLELKRSSPLPDYFTIELAHGYYGYLPTPAQHELGGYETWLGTNRLEVPASDKMIAALQEMLQQVAQPNP